MRELDHRFKEWTARAVSDRKNELKEWALARLQSGPSREFILANPVIVSERIARLLDIIVGIEGPGLGSRVTGYINVSVEAVMGFGGPVELMNDVFIITRDLILDEIRNSFKEGSIEEPLYVHLIENIHTLFSDLDRVLLDVALRKTLERFGKAVALNETIIENLEEGILVEDDGLRITYVNPKMAEMLGYTQDELVGQHWKMTVAEEDLPKVAKESTMRDKGNKGRYVLNLKKKDGTLFPVLVSANPFFENGEFKGVISAATDITKFKELEMELKNSKDELQRMNIELKRFNVRLAEDNIRLRKMMDITPEREDSDGTVPAYHFEPANVFIIKLDGSFSPITILKDLVMHGMEGLVITREMPQRVKEEHGLEKTAVIWLTMNTVKGVDTISPTNLVDLSSVVISFLEKAENGIVMIEGIEYLIAQNSFDSTLNLIQLIRDRVMLSRSRLLLPLDQTILDPREVRMIAKEGIVYDVHEKDLEHFLAMPR